MTLTHLLLAMGVRSSCGVEAREQTATNSDSAYSKHIWQADTLALHWSYKANVANK